jgi:hypothetical protein
MKIRIAHLLIGTATVSSMLFGAALAQPAASFAKGVSMRVTCQTYDEAEFALLTGIDSPYGGTLCVRH